MFGQSATQTGDKKYTNELMATFPCPERITCPPGTDGDDNPVRNRSSERDDGPVFTGNNYPVVPPDPTGSDPTVYQAAGCISTCTSTESQEAADLCAAAQAVLCLGSDGGSIKPPGVMCPTPPCSPPVTPPDIPPGFPVGNVAKTGTATCADGSTFTYTVPAGAILAATQDLADTIAQATATEQANKKIFCLGDITGAVCANGSYLSRFDLPDRGPFTVAVSAGSLPPGITLSLVGNQVTLQGSCATPDTYTFSLRATDAAGNHTERAYTVRVMGLAVTTLPDAATGQPYTYALVVVGGVPPYIFTLGPGAPAGIVINPSNGLIFGTPSGAATYSFDVSIMDSGG